MVLQDDHRAAGLAERAAFAAGFDQFRLKKVFVLHIQVGTSQTFLLIEVDRRGDKWGEDNFEVYHTRIEQHCGLIGLAGSLEG
jgi:hypothetical protein